jgi:serine/threonine-protein kinase
VGAAQPNERAVGGDGISTYASPGTVLAQKYRVERVLGRGGMAVVVAAKHLQLREIVAVKLLHPHVLANPRAVERFLREARVAMRLRSDHVARVYDVGALDDRTPFVVMECLTGEDLGAVLRTRGRLELSEAVDYVLQACEGLAEAHALGVVHRDLKPANLFLTTRMDGSPSVKVLDFGVSKTTIELSDDAPSAREMSVAEPLEETAPPSMPAIPHSRRGTPPPTSTLPGGVGPAVVEDTRRSEVARQPMNDSPPIALGGITMTQAFLGSPKYVSPEQLRSARDADVRSDIWALGVILQELVSGLPPFAGETLEAISDSILHEKPAPLRVPGTGRLEHVLARCLAKERTNRYSNVQQFAEALVPFASEEGRVSAGRILRMVSGKRPNPPASASHVRIPLRPSSRRTAVTLGLLGVVLAGVGAAAVLRSSPPFRTSAPADPSPAVALVPPHAEPAVEPLPPLSSASAEPSSSATAPAASSLPATSPSPKPAPSAPSAKPAPPEASAHARKSAHPAPAKDVDPLGVQGGSLFDNRR